MIESTNNFAKTTNLNAINSVLDDTLRSLRISGSVLLRESYAAPWAVSVPRANDLVAMLGLRDDVRVVAFHLVELGHCEIKLERGERLLLNAGDLAICFAGAAHRITLGKPVQTQPIEQLLSGSKNTQRPSATRPTDTSLLCGAFLLRYGQLNPLLSALPSVLHATLSKSGQLHNLSGVARLLADEIDRSGTSSGYVIERLLEVLCAESIRAFVETTHQETGWFRGLKDPVVGRAIAAIHANPGADWSVRRLADAVSMSPSRFAARFAESMGDSTMAYLAKWRMNVACRKLASTRVGVEVVAGDLGYESVPAFNRAFKKLVGLPPASWRVRQRERP
jgi:AraC-like DNA-binding protein